MKNNLDFINIKDENVELNFSTANKNLDFNINNKKGIENLNNLKNLYKLKAVAYLKQIHSDKIYVFDGKDHEGDALITDKPDVAIGIFTADCVPVLMYSKEKGVIAAVHSGWKGTFLEIAAKTAKKMSVDFGVNFEDLNVYIGPHNRVCCYDFGEDIAKQFANKGVYHFSDIYVNGKLNLSKCITIQLKKIGILENKIHDLNLCTSCSKEYKFFSYRNNNKCGRMYSFIYIK